KVIISHDVDHITVWEHKKDLIIPKFIIRSFIEYITGNISKLELWGRLKSLVKNKWNNIEELMKFNKENNIPSTFFIAVSNGMGLNYSLRDASSWAKKILQEGFDVGVHGISYDVFSDIKKEHEIFVNLTALKKFGIRMHYLRNNDNTLKFLSNTGYLFDSSIFSISNPFKIGNLWEFPLHIMDGYIICKNARWQNQSLQKIKDSTKIIIDTVYNRKIKYLTILFHDRYFNDGFQTWKNWYLWLVEYLKLNKFNFISYREAINELELNSKQQ
ncbi:MAG: hypothetical protein ACK4ND_18665, partial [Cytophagaceae bacterium]